MHEGRRPPPPPPPPPPPTVGPRAFCLPLRPAAAANEQGVAGANRDARKLLPGLEIFRINRSARLEPADVLEPRHVDEDAAGHVSRAHPVGCRFAAPGRGEGERKAVIAHRRLTRLPANWTLIVAERIHVGAQAVVYRKLDDVQSTSHFTCRWIDPGHAVHVFAEAPRIASGLLEGVDLKCNRCAFHHEGRRLLRLLGRDEVQQPALVIFTPPPPVGQLLLPPFQLIQRNKPRGLLGRRMGSKRLAVRLTGHQGTLRHKKGPEEAECSYCKSREPMSLNHTHSFCSGCSRILAGISDLLAPDGTFIHPRAAERTKFCSAHNRPAPEAVTSAHADVEPTGAAAFRAFLRHRSTLVPFLRQPSLHSAARQPAGTGSAQILHSISPKSRRFRCPSASRSQ